MDIPDNKTQKNAAMVQIGAVQEILKRWDPMDLATGAFAPKDEYDTYTPHIVSMVCQNSSVEDLLTHLQLLKAGMVCMRYKDDTSIAHEIIKALRPQHV